MNLLHAVVLSAIFVKCILATTTTGIQFREAISRRDLDASVKLYKERSSRRRDLDHVFETEDPDFIAGFINQADLVNSSTLIAFYSKNPETTVDQLLERVRFSQESLAHTAASQLLMHSPGKIIGLLKRMTKPECLKFAIKESVKNLVREGNVDSIEALLTALEGEESLKYLNDIAIQMVFANGVDNGKENCVRSFYGDLAITPQVYTEGLAGCEEDGVLKPFFGWLLVEADQMDLLTLQKRSDYKYKSADFRAAVDKALSTAKPEGTRHRSLLIQRAEIAMKTFDELTGTLLGTKGPGSIIGSYLTAEFDTENGNETTNQQNIGSFRDMDFDDEYVFEGEGIIIPGRSPLAPPPELPPF